MTKRRILIAGFITLLIIAVLSYNYYKKPRKDVASVEAAYSLMAEDLYQQFVRDEAAANLKYAGKIIEVSGLVEEVKIDSVSAILLSAGNGEGGVNCSLKNSDMARPAEGERIIVKGNCTGFLLDVNLVDVLIINEQDR